MFDFLHESSPSWPPNMIPIETLYRALKGLSKSKGGLNTRCLRKILSVIGKPIRGKNVSATQIRAAFIENFNECCSVLAYPIWTQSELQALGADTSRQVVMSREAFAAYYQKPIAFGPRTWLRARINPVTGNLLPASNLPTVHDASGPSTRQRLRVAAPPNPYPNWLNPNPLGILPGMRHTWNQWMEEDNLESLTAWVYPNPATRPAWGTVPDLSCYTSSHRAGATESSHAQVSDPVYRPQLYAGRDSATQSSGIVFTPMWG